MAIRDKLRERVQPYVEPGEQVQQVFIAQTGPSPWLMGLLGGLLIMLLMKPRIIVVTDRRIIVLRGGRFAVTQPKEQLAVLARQTTIGPVKGLWTRTNLGAERMWVHRRFKQDVEAADAAIASGTA